MTPKVPLLKEDTLRVYEFLKEYLSQNHSLAPTQRQIATGCYVSVGQVSRHLDLLEAHGLIAREPGRARAIWLLTDADGP